MSAAWHPDPTGRHELRYWDGATWTDHVSDGGATAISPLQVEAGPAEHQQVASQHVEQQQGPSHQSEYEPVHAGQPTQQPAAQAMPQPSGDAFAGITGDLVDGRFSERTGAGAELQNSKLLRVRIVEPFFARQGAMVAYQGNVAFAYQGGGAAKFLKKTLTGEGLSLMRVEGQGDVFLADSAKHVHVLHLNNTGISINGSNVLAFSAGLDWNIERVKGGSIAAGGLFNTMLRGTGWVALTTHGEPVVLDAGEAPTFADTDAIVAWSAHLQTSLKSSMSAGALIGRGSGEAIQVSFSGQGFVIVQPSEGVASAAAAH